MIDIDSLIANETIELEDENAALSLLTEDVLTGGGVTGQEGLSPQITNDNHYEVTDDWRFAGLTAKTVFRSSF